MVQVFEDGTHSVVTFDTAVLKINGVAVTSTAVELNILDGATLSTTELNYVTGVTSSIQTQLNSKEPTLTKGNLTETTSSVLTIVGGTGSIIGSGVTIEVDQADTSNDGYLSSVDWNTFNNKQSALTFGIADTNAVDIDSASVANGEIARFTANGLESRSNAELKSQLSYMTDFSDDTTPTAGGELDMSTHSVGFTAQSATGDGTTTIDWGNGNKFNFTFGAFNETFTFTAPAKPGNFILKLVQDATGSRTATWPASVKWSGGTAPTLSTAASSVDIVSFYYDGSNYYGVGSLNFS